MGRHAFSEVRGRRGRWAAALTVLTVLGAAPPRAGALNLEEWLPGLTLTPFLSERMEYETNVFQTSSNEKSSMISRTTPGFLVEYGRGTLQLAAGYRAEILHYFDLEGLDTVNHNFVGQGKLTLAKLQLMFRDDYIQTTVPPGTELTGPIKSNTNTLAPTAEYKLTDRFSLGANYTWTHISFPGSDSSSAANAGPPRTSGSATSTAPSPSPPPRTAMCGRISSPSRCAGMSPPSSPRPSGSGSCTGRRPRAWRRTSPVSPWAEAGSSG